MPNLEHYQRARELREFVKRELDRYDSGEINSLPSNSDLMHRFGYKDPSRLYPVLRPTGFFNRRRLLESDPRHEISPSSGTAWIIGALTGSGHVNAKSGRITLGSKDLEMLQEFKSVSQRALGVSASLKETVIRAKEGRETKRRFVNINNKAGAAYLGDLRQDRWVDTVASKHKWIQLSDRYTWSFLEGLFEVRGDIYIYDPGARLMVIKTASLSGANFISELMVRAGIKDPHIRHSAITKEGVDGVMLGETKDLYTFAQNIHSQIRRKEEKLKLLRAKQFRLWRPNNYSDEQILEEWKQIILSLGPVPKANDIKRLYKEGEIGISPETYARRFGQGSFTRARQALGQMIEST